MNRIIKFRGKRVDNGEWVYGYYRETQGYDCESLHLIHSIELAECEDYIVEAETVGQYTGLRDKNGKEIYEGDIVQSNNFLPSIVNFNNGSFYFYDLSVSDIDYIDDWEVIGNVNENKELIGGER